MMVSNNSSFWTSEEFIGKSIHMLTQFSKYSTELITNVDILESSFRLNGKSILKLNTKENIYLQFIFLLAKKSKFQVT